MDTKSYRLTIQTVDMYLVSQIALDIYNKKNYTIFFSIPNNIMNNNEIPSDLRIFSIHYFAFNIMMMMIEINWRSKNVTNMHRYKLYFRFACVRINSTLLTLLSSNKDVQLLHSVARHIKRRGWKSFAICREKKICGRKITVDSFIIEKKKKIILSAAAYLHKYILSSLSNWFFFTHDYDDDDDDDENTIFFWLLLC